MFLDDSPIRQESDDLLNRSEFAKKIGDSIINLNAENGLCIGMFGPWGSGKTSILYMLLEEINQKVAKQKTRPIILSFNPWNFTTAEQLFHQFFYMLADEFASSSEQAIKEIGDAFKKYANIAAEISSVTQFNALQLAFSSIGAVSKFLSPNNILNDNDLTKQRDIIIKRLREQKQKIIIVIDDIDRLPNDEIRLIFQLVNSVAKFPNTIYLLSFDRNIVANALSKIQNSDGNDFLEKIIQVPIEIPEIREDSLNKILFTKLDEILKTYGLGLDQGHWQFVFKDCLEGNVKTIRDINRLINTLHTKCLVVGNEVDFADLVAISFIENNYPDLYYWIKKNPEKLVGGKEFWKDQNKSYKSIIEEHKNEMVNLFHSNGELYNDMLGVLFPYWSQYNSETTEKLWRKRRIGHKEFFYRYFCLGLDNGQISREIIDKALFIFDEQDLSNFLDEVNYNYSGKFFLNELRAALEELGETRKLLIAKVLIRKAGAFKEERESLFDFPIHTLIEFEIKNLLNSIKDEHLVYGLLKDVIINADENSVLMVSKLIDSIKTSYERLAEDNQKRDDNVFLVSEEHLLKCEKLFSDKILQIARTTDLFDLPHAGRILYLFERVDNKNFNDYINSRINDSLEILKYLQTFASEIYVNGVNSGWNYQQEYVKHLSEDKIEKAYTESLKDGSIWKLSDEMQLKIIAFEFSKMKKRDWEDCIPKSVVEKRLNELKQTNINFS